jgi:hypothetical protein
MVTIWGMINGSVTLKNERTLPAPSTVAASYTSWGTACNAARKTMARKGVLFQTFVKITAILAGQNPMSQSTWSPTVRASTSE